MKFKAAIFDLDGTLLDSLSDIADSMNSVLYSHGFAIHETDKYRYFIGEGMRVMTIRALPDNITDNKLIDMCTAEMKDEYAKRWKCKTHIYNGILELLKFMHQSGMPIAVLSNKPHKFTVEMVDYFFENSIFKIVLGAGSFAEKPDPEAALEIARLLGVEPSDFLYVGDSAVDMKTAKAAGMFACGVLWGFRQKEELESAGADLIVKNPDQIRMFL